MNGRSDIKINDNHFQNGKHVNQITIGHSVWDFGKFYRKRN